MKITLNGNLENVPEKCSIAQLVQEKGYESTKIAVEVNGAIVPKAKYDQYFVSECDTMEVVTFVGGG